MRFLDEAIRRAQYRRSPWKVVLLPVFALSVGVSWYALVELLLLLHKVLYHQLGRLNSQAPPSLPQIIVFVLPFFAVLLPSMVLSNFLVYYGIPEARRAFEKEAAVHPELGLAESNQSLIKLMRLVTPTALMACIVAALWP